MGQIILVRHGQANSGAKTEEEYDRLSPLGAQQADLLGAHLRQQGFSADRVVHGSLQRQKATAAALGDIGARCETDARLNELDYLTLGRALELEHGVAQPGPDEFMDHFVDVMQAWKMATIKGQETFESFEARVSGVLEEATQPGKTVVCVTSGGVIAMIIRHLLRLDLPAMARVALPIWNTSMHRIAVSNKGAVLSSFNEIPHLDGTRTDMRSVY